MPRIGDRRARRGAGPAAGDARAARAAQVPAAPDPASIVSTPSRRTLYKGGPSGRFLVDGTWLFRSDPTGNGDLQGWQRSPDTAGWTATTVPNAWNATDESVGSYTGAVGWYRKDFRLPERASALTWVVRFESVNYRSRVWLNGQPDRHARRRLPAVRVPAPARLLKRGGVNRLVVRDRQPAPPDRLPALRAPTHAARPTGGWWNYGGILREVYLRKVDDVDFDDRRRSARRCHARPARRPSATRVTVRNAGLDGAAGAASRARFGDAGGQPRHAGVGPKRFAIVHARRCGSPRPRLWSPDAPVPLRPRCCHAGRARAKAARSRRYTPRPASARSRSSTGGCYLNGRAAQLPRRRAARGRPARASRSTTRAREQQLARTQGARRDADPLPLPAAPVQLRSAPTSSG